MKSEPWSFEKHLVVMQRYESDMSIQDLKFEKITFWVQVHGLLLRFLTLEATMKIFSMVGEVIRPADPRVAYGGEFMRVQISIDISLTLCQCLLISLSNDK